MKKVFNILILVIMVVICGCSNLANSSYNEESKSNSISYRAKDKYVRSAVNNLDQILHIDIYKVPVLSSGKFDYNNKEFVRTEPLKQGEEKEIERCSEKGYRYAVNCQEYPFLCTWYGYKNDLNFFEYENNIVLQEVMYFNNSVNHGLEYREGLHQFSYSNGDGRYFTYNFFGNNSIENCKKYIEEYYE